MPYIDKQSLLNDLNETTPRSYFEFETMVREYPTADVAPVTHAHWESADLDEDMKTCSRCELKDCEGRRFFFFRPHWDYCPNCGARMYECMEVEE